MIIESSAVAFRQNLGEMLDIVQYRNDSVLIKKDGKPVAALIDARLFERIRRMQERFDALCDRLEQTYTGVPEDEALAEIERATSRARAETAVAWRAGGRLPAVPARRTRGVAKPAMPATKAPTPSARRWLQRPRQHAEHSHAARARHQCAVSGLLFTGGPPSRLVKAWRAGAFDLVISDFVIDEPTRTWAHLARRLKALPDDLVDFVDTLGVRAELLRIDEYMLAQAGTAELRDPNDLPVLALLIGSGADHLVTGDKDLLALADTDRILTPADFVARFVP